MIKVKHLRVASLVKGFHDLFWEIEDTTEDVLDYTFAVERSESPEGEFDPVSEPFRDRYVYRDIMPHPFERWRKLWYRLKITKVGGTPYYTDAVSLEPKVSLDAAEMRRAVALVLKAGTGRVAWIFARRTFGQRCPGCWDDVLKKTMSSKCETCYNTGYARGFLDPIPARIQFDPAGKSIRHGPLIKTEPQDTRVLIPYFPPVKPKDIIVEAENRRWRVTEIITSERLRSVVRQGVYVHELPPSDIEFRIPINIEDLRELQPDPDHVFSYPHTPEAAGSDIMDTVQVFGWDGS